MIDFTPGVKRSPQGYAQDYYRGELDWRPEYERYHESDTKVPDQRHSRGAEYHHHHRAQAPGHLRMRSPELSFTSDHDNTGRYKSYKDSSGDQGEITLQAM